MASSVLDNVTKPYSFLESLIYDRMIAPAVLAMATGTEEDFVSRIPENAAVLDVGCGGGHILEHLAGARPDLSLTGVDLSIDQVRRARKRLRRFGGRTEVLEGSALALPFGDGRFDVVYSMASIKHWPDQLLGLRECTRVLRSQGRLFVIEADRSCRVDDVKRFTRNWKVPRFLGAVPVVVFRTWVAGHSLDLDDARALLEKLGLEAGQVSRIENTPALMIEGIRP